MKKMYPSLAKKFRFFSTLQYKVLFYHSVDGKFIQIINLIAASVRSFYKACAFQNCPRLLSFCETNCNCSGN